jgi:death-on-curing protein
MTRYLELEDLEFVVERMGGKPPELRDVGLIVAALARPRARVNGVDVYPSLALKAAALLSSLATCSGMVSGNVRAAWVATRVFCAANGAPLAALEDDAVETVRQLTAGELTLETLAARLGSWLTPQVMP